jgi:Tol biopolymer transport system component
MLRWLLLLAVCSTLGCSGGNRTITISTIPPDATLRVDGNPRGRGPITETFNFSGDTVSHTVTAQRVGYSDQDVTVLQDSPGDTRVIRLKPVSRRVTIRVRPVPAVVSLNGRRLAPDPVSEVTTDLEFPLDAAGRWTTHRITAEHPRFRPVDVTATFDDGRREYDLNLETLRKNLIVTTVPEGADVFINDETLGRSTVTHKDFAFPVDPATGEFKPQQLRIEKRGYQTEVTQIGWDDGKENYTFELEPQSKVVRIVTDPPDARVELNGAEVPLDDSGAHSARFEFAPINEEGDAPVLQGVVTKEAPGREWESKPITVGWDDGRTDYEVKLKEILTRPVPMTRLRTAFGAQGWSITPESSTSVAMRDTAEPAGPPEPQRVTKLPAGTMLDTLALAPDGSQLLYTTLSAGEDGTAAPRSQMFLQRTEGPPDVRPLSDGRTLDVTPTFTPDGALVVFASNRAGRALNIWSVTTGDAGGGGGGGPEQLTEGDANDLWPSVDSSPKPRLFYQSLIHTRGEPRLFSVPLGAMTPRRDLSPTGGGTQPRVGPKADAVVFAAPHGPKRKRDLFRVSDTGAGLVNLTDTPDVDEFDPAWSDDGRRIAFASDRGRTKDAPDNYDLYVLDVTRPGGGAAAAEPIRVTHNGSWDDSPAWDVGGGALYFRSNRGGEWNVWRIELRR